LTSGSAAQAGVDAATLLDPARTPVLRLRRCVLRDDGSLDPPGVQGLASPPRSHPPRVFPLPPKPKPCPPRDPPRFAGNPPHLTRESSHPAPVSARRHATAWIHSGGRFYF